MTQQQPTVADAIAILAGRCNWAQTQDGMGFNKMDTGFGHFLAGIPSDQWKPKWLRAAWKMTRKYRGQLGGAGLDWDAIPEPPEVTEATAAAAPVQRSITLTGSTFVLAFPYEPEIVAVVRTLPRRKFDGAKKQWTAPAHAENAACLRGIIDGWTWTLGDGVADRLALLDAEAARMSVEREETKVASRATDAQIEVAGLGGELLPFQRAGVAYIVKHRRVLLADEMGLGKTVQGLAGAQALDAFPVLVICPATLKRNWEREARKWLPGKMVGVLGGAGIPDTTLLREGHVVIVNYDQLTKRLAQLQAVAWKGLVLDEAHYCKNHKAQRTVAVRELAKGKALEMVLLLTGTPVLNRPQELTTPLQILGRLDDLGGFWKFLRACGMEKGEWGGLVPVWEREEVRAARLAKVNEMLRSVCLIRRVKADVLPELPAKRRTTIPVQITNRAEYTRAEANLVRWLQQTEGAEAAEKATLAEQLVRVEKLKGLAARGKLKAVTEWVTDFLESGEKLVLFAHHIELQHQLLAEFTGAARVLGEDSPEERDAQVARFQTDESCRLIICSLKAGGVGITLTAASNVAFIELGWTPADHDQAEDRCHRIGQTDSVTAWYLLAEETIEEEIGALVDSKRQVVNALTDGKLTLEAGSSILGELMAKMRARVPALDLEPELETEADAKGYDTIFGRDA